VAASVALPVEEDAELAVNTADLMHLRRVVEEKDGGPAWIHMMDRTLPTFRYQAWRRDMEVCTTLQSFSPSMHNNSRNSYYACTHSKLVHT
jgi:hypothetical protein